MSLPLSPLLPLIYPTLVCAGSLLLYFFSTLINVLNLKYAFSEGNILKKKKKTLLGPIIYSGA